MAFCLPHSFVYELYHELYLLLFCILCWKNSYIKPVCGVKQLKFSKCVYWIRASDIFSNIYYVNSAIISSNVGTVLPEIMAQALILSNNFSPWLLKEIGDYARLVLLVEVLNKSFGRWILMAAKDTRVADPIDVVYHEMDSTVCSHRVYISVWSPVIGEQLVLEKEPAGQSTQWTCGMWQW